MKKEIKEILNGFEKRMKFINVVRRILDYSCPDDIYKMFPNRTELDNLIVAVLLFIKDRTLGNNESCKLSDIKYFIEEITTLWFPEKEFDCEKLSSFIIIIALQNRGENKNYLTYDSLKSSFFYVPIRLLDQEDGDYKLTDDAFDFLFRSKEIESEIDYSVTRFKMMEYIKRANYSEALDQSRELVSRIRSMKQSMNSFLQRCKENIALISVDEYEKIIRKIRILLDEEEKELKNINNEVLKKRDLLENTDNHKDEKITEHLRALNQVSDNINITIQEQNVLINKKSSLAESYKNILEASFATKTFKRMDFEKDIMQLLRKCDGEKLSDAAAFLLFPLTKPSFERMFSIENFYAVQSPLNEGSKATGTDLDEIETEKEDIIQIRNDRNKRICIALFDYLFNKEVTTAKAFIESLKLSDLFDLCKENALPQALMILYGMGEIIIEGWENALGYNTAPQGEFELLWWLKYVPTEQLNMKKIIITKLDEPNFKIDISSNNNNKCFIDMTNFEMRVIR